LFTQKNVILNSIVIILENNYFIREYLFNTSYGEFMGT